MLKGDLFDNITSMNQETPNVIPEKQEKPKSEFVSSDEGRVEKINEGTVLGTIAIIGVGVFAAKKFWDWKGEEIKKQVSPMVDEAIDKVLNNAKGKLFETISSTFQSGKKLDEKLISKSTDSAGKSEDKKVFEDGFSGLGVDAKVAAEGKKESIFNDIFLNKLQKQGERFGALADEDPVFAAEVNSLSLQNQEDIMSFVRSLDTDTRGKISLAFLSGNLQAAEEATDDIQEKTRPFEEVPLEKLNKDELYDLADKIVNDEEKRESSGGVIPRGHKLYDYLRIEIKNDLILREQGEETTIDSITAGFSAYKSARTEKLAGVIRSAVERYIQDNPEESRNFGFIREGQEEQPSEEIRNARKMDRMKEEYRRLLRERYTVQKVTLKIMADFIKYKK